MRLNKQKSLKDQAATAQRGSLDLLQCPQIASSFLASDRMGFDSMVKSSTISSCYVVSSFFALL